MIKRFIFILFGLFFPILLMLNVIRFTTDTTTIFGFNDLFTSMQSFSGESFTNTLNCLDNLKNGLDSFTNWNTIYSPIITSIFNVLGDSTNIFTIVFSIFNVIYRIATTLISISMLIVNVVILLSVFIVEAMPLFTYFIQLVSTSFTHNVDSILGSIIKAEVPYQDYTSWYSSYFSIN